MNRDMQSVAVAALAWNRARLRRIELGANRVNFPCFGEVTFSPFTGWRSNCRDSGYFPRLG